MEKLKYSTIREQIISSASEDGQYLKLFTEQSGLLEIRGRFDNSCRIFLSDQSVKSIKERNLTVRILQHGKKSVISNSTIFISAIIGNIIISLGNDDAIIQIGKNVTGMYDLRLWRSSIVKIGENTTSSGVRIVCDKSSVMIGRDCMLSDTILIQSADQHGIVEAKTGAILNDTFRIVDINDHVWLGRASILMSDIAIGCGSIVATGAIVTKNIPELCIAAGNPAKIIKTGYTWSRSPVELDQFSQSIVSEYADRMTSIGNL